MDEKLNFKEFMFSPFKDNYETKKIKNYVKQLAQLEDFKNLKLFFIEYNSDAIDNKKFKLMDLAQTFKRKITTIGTSILPFDGSYDLSSKKINIYIDSQIKFGKLKSVKITLPIPKVELIKYPNAFKKTCSNILVSMFHEKKHYLQDTTSDNSFSSIMYQIEKNIKNSIGGVTRYSLKHDKWYFEIDANNYGVEKAEEYYLTHPNDENVDWFYLKKLKRKYEYEKLTYDFDEAFTIYNIYREKTPFISNITNRLTNIFQIDKNTLWHQVLYGDKKRLKSVDEILNHQSFDKIDPEFMNNVLTSRYLNKNTDYNSLDKLSLNKLKKVFDEKLTKTMLSCQIILHHKDEKYIKRSKKDIKRLKENITYYKNMLELINTKLLEYNKGKKNKR